jgi:hypothetical protein
MDGYGGMQVPAQAAQQAFAQPGDEVLRIHVSGRSLRAPVGAGQPEGT